MSLAGATSKRMLSPAFGALILSAVVLGESTHAGSGHPSTCRKGESILCGKDDQQAGAAPAPQSGSTRSRATDHAAPSMPNESRWTLMDDGSCTLMLNAQGGPRGETEVRAPNWWMGMATHRLGPGTFSA
jgi:hypothetical protein